MNGLQRRWLEKADEQSDKLNDWEQGFVENLVEQDDDYELSDSQNKKLNEINTKLSGY